MAASALPVSLSAVMLNRTSATAIIGTITMIMKNSNRRLRKLIFLADAVPLKLLCPYGLTFRRQPFVRRLHGTMQVAGATIRSAVRGAIAQLGERLDRTQEVAGSSPASSILEAYSRVRASGLRAAMRATTEVWCHSVHIPAPDRRRSASG